MHTPLSRTAIFRPVGWTISKGPAEVDPRLSRRRERDAAIRWIDDERGPSVRRATISPKLVIGEVDVALGGELCPAVR